MDVKTCSYPRHVRTAPIARMHRPQYVITRPPQEFFLEIKWSDLQSWNDHGGHINLPRFVQLSDVIWGF